MTSVNHHDLLRRHGDQPAIVMAGSGRTVSYRELDERSTRLARVFDEAGLRPGDHVALMLGNQPEFFDVLWAALRSGLYVTPINWHLGTDEAAYIIGDCNAKVFVTSFDLAHVAEELATRLPKGTTTSSRRWRAHLRCRETTSTLGRSWCTRREPPGTRRAFCVPCRLSHSAPRPTSSPR
jgi:acyl-CoA synthetase (AMP-forming)/AMP-acid ligase II